MPSLTDLANPTRFMRLSERLTPWLVGAAGLMLAVGLYLAFFVAPPDYQQGDSVRIMYVHVPAAWMALICYTLMTASALGTLVWRHPLADVSLKSAAPLGAAFTFLALATGSIWGKPMWGTWWVWDARLTSVFVLFLIYLGIIALTRALDDPSRSARAAAARLAAPSWSAKRRAIVHALATRSSTPRRPSDRSTAYTARPRAA